MFDSKSFSDAKSEILSKTLSSFPNTPVLTLAKMLHKTYPSLWTSVESARTQIRQKTGLAGKKSRKKSNEFTKPLSYNYNPFDDIPRSHEIEREPYKLPSSIKSLIILSDIHFPYHNESALKAAIDYSKSQKIDAILLNGDILDLYTMSDFLKDPTKPKIKEELEMGRWFLASLRKLFPKIPIYYKIGNHEVRLERWLKVKAPEFLGTSEFELSTLLQFGKHKVQLIDSLTSIQYGNLTIIHGHEYKGSGTVNPARNTCLKTKVSTLVGHFHKTSEYMGRKISGEYIKGYSTGCLCEISPDYMPYNEWNHGFAHAFLDSNGNCNVLNKIIEKGKVS